MEFIYSPTFLLYNSRMKKSGLPPLWVIIVIIVIILISELSIRVMSSETGFISISSLTLFIWGIVMICWGVFSILSYFFETRWKGFYGLVWVYKYIIPAGGKTNALIFGVIGILVGVVSLIWLNTH